MKRLGLLALLLLPAAAAATVAGAGSAMFYLSKWFAEAVDTDPENLDEWP